MKKTSSKSRGSAAMGNAAAKDVDEYLAGVPEPAHSTLQKLRGTIRSVVPPETTEVIAYRIPMFKYKGLLVGFAGFSNHCSFFPGRAIAAEEFKEELKNYETSKGTIRFPVDKPLPAALVKKIVKARIAENERKNRGA